MKKRLTIILLAICCFFAPIFSGCTLNTEDLEDLMPTKILFLGNSLMYYNNMPQIFEQLAYADDNPLIVRSVTEGSATIRKFGNKDQNGTGKLAHYYLTTEKWDYVVIEPSRRIKEINETTASSKDLKDSDYTDYKLELENALYLEQLVHKYSENAKVVLYSVWGERKLDKDSNEKATINDIVYRKSKTELMYEANVKIASALNQQIKERDEENKYEVSIIKAGHAFENYITNKENYTDQIDYSDGLYHDDNQHASLRGSYLAACTAYTTIFDRVIKKDEDTIKYDGNTTGDLKFDGTCEKDGANYKEPTALDKNNNEYYTKYQAGKHYLTEDTYKSLQKTAYKTYADSTIKVAKQKNALIIGSTSDSFGIRERNNLEKLITKNQDETLNVYTFLNSNYSIEDFTDKNEDDDNYTLNLKDTVTDKDNPGKTKEVTTELGFIYKNIKDFDYIVIQLPRYSNDADKTDTVTRYNNFKTIVQNEVLVNKLLNWTDKLYIMTLSSASSTTTAQYETDASTIVSYINNTDIIKDNETKSCYKIQYALDYKLVIDELKKYLCTNVSINETKLKNVIISTSLYESLYAEDITSDIFKGIYGNLSYTDMFVDTTTDDNIDDLNNMSNTTKVMNFTEVIYNVLYPTAA